MIRIWSILSFIIALAASSSCSRAGDERAMISPPPPPPTIPPPLTSAPRTYLALGDSYTIGQNVPPAQRFPVLTRDWLQALGINMGSPRIIATSGWTTGNLQSVLDTQPVTDTFSVVSLLIGVNDQYQGFDTSIYRIRFTRLLEQSIGFAGNRASRVFVLSIPDYSVTPFARNSDTARIRKEIDQFNQINQEVSATYSVNYLNITPSTREAKNNPTLLASDGLHPSGIEYRKWAERLGQQMKAALQ